MKQITYIIIALVIVLLITLIVKDRVKYNDYDNMVSNYQSDIKALYEAYNALKLESSVLEDSLQKVIKQKPQIITYFDTIYKEVEALPANEALENFDKWTEKGEDSKLLEGKAVIDTLKITTANLTYIKFQRSDSLLALSNDIINIQDKIIVNYSDRLENQRQIIGKKDQVIEIKDSELQRRKKEIRNQKLQKYLSFAATGAALILLLIK